MIGTGILSFLSKINLYYGRKDEDFIDRMNNTWSAYLLIVLAIIISAKQMFGNAISCWFPAEFPKPWIQYAENYCWVQNTYFIPMNASIPNQHEKRSTAELSYYQWVPFVLALQALMFYIPAMIWRLLNWQTGMNIQGLLNIVTDIQATDEATINRMKSMVQHTVAYGKRKSKQWKQQVIRILVCFNGNQRFGNYLISVYLLTKVLYLTNIILQFYLVTNFIGNEYHNHVFYAIDMLREFARGDDWKTTGHFPRVTMCDFTVRSLGQPHKYTVQCVLPVNMLNEKLYIFVYFWLMLMATLTSLSLVTWVYNIFFSDPESFLRKYIDDDQYREEGNNVDIVKRIAMQDLKRDGLFVLRLLSSNVGETITSRVVRRLWDERKSMPVPTPVSDEPPPRGGDEIPLLPRSGGTYPSLDEFSNP